MLLSAVDVARLALAQGLTPEQATIAVAIARYESVTDRGIFDTDAVGDEALVDDKWGPSIGLWQIRSLNSQKGTGQARDATRLKDPDFNARSMYLISAGGTYWRPWSVYLHDTYLNYMTQAAEAVKEALMPTARQFVDLLLSQDGDKYVWGAEASASDTNPSAFDCSELVQWGCARLGVKAPDGSWYQARWCKMNGTLIPVQEGIDTLGALLFRFDSDPFTTTPGNRHVAVSQGNGKTIEARGTKFGVGQFDTAGRGWTHAGLVPGLTYGDDMAFTDHEEHELKAYVAELDKLGSNSGFLVPLILDIRKNIITRDELDAAIAKVEADGGVDQTARQAIAALRKYLQQVP